MQQDWAKNQAATYWETEQSGGSGRGGIGSLVYCSTLWEQKAASAHQQTDGHLKPWGWAGVIKGLVWTEKRSKSKTLENFSSEVREGEKEPAKEIETEAREVRETSWVQHLEAR